MATTITVTAPAESPTTTWSWGTVSDHPTLRTIWTTTFPPSGNAPVSVVIYTQAVEYVGGPTTKSTDVPSSSAPTSSIGQYEPSTTPGSSTVETSGTSTASQASVIASSSAASQNNGNKGTDVGAIAGAAVGSAIAGALIAFLVCFLFYRRKRRNDRGGVYTTEKPSSAHTWDAFLPQSADDGTIQRSVNALYSQIDMHVENYYGSNAMASVSTESRVCLQKVDSGNLPNSAEELMRETTSPLPVIKHCFAWTILSRLSPTSAGEDSLLPPELARLPPKQTMSKSRSERESRAMTQAYPYWRILTAHLLYPHSRQNSATSTLNAHGADGVVQILMTAFQPWSKTVKGGTSAAEHLSSVVKTATETGLLIMSQPSTFAFEWDGLDHAASTVVVLPAFEKIADERGQTLSQRYFLVNPKMENISK